jgi:hypothetical protein
MDIVELTPDLHMLRFTVGQAYLLRDEDSLTLIDTGLPAPEPTSHGRSAVSTWTRPRCVTSC